MDEPDACDGPWAEGWKIRSGEEEPSKQTLTIALGKVLVGYRPGDEMWSEHDQAAIDYALGDALAQGYEHHVKEDFIAGFICAGGEVEDAKDQAEQYLSCLQAVRES